MSPILLIFMLSATKRRVINGLMILKNAYGRYVKVGIPKTPLLYAAQVFQGTKTEVTVPESSNVLLKFSGANPFLAYALENIFPGTTNAKYWSEVVTFNAKQLITVLANSPKVEVNKCSKKAVIRSKAPIASITPPKAIAQIMSHIVLSIPLIPEEENNSFRFSLSVGICVEVVIVSIITL
ncbi:hypothetical protein CCYN74_100149 [Capnocytophaga cynodegmi]|uniref:Uncharacterized protein n=1 Tax=Capnocytophaga cynodegmi TaxID=28189 RepID=A0A0B7H9X1_9FLAO|nr:hypothetical protein CCYN74_100149 [Capnocytophaga cynodegmi]